jgi:hypothetical protein
VLERAREELRALDGPPQAMVLAERRRAGRPRAEL